MGGSSNDLEIASPSNVLRTLVLVGRRGNGKSATGNSILGIKNAFTSRASSSGVTSTCEMKSAKLKDGKILNVIDTPGLFGSSVAPEFIGKEIVKCINMAKDGIHAFLLVLTVGGRFSKEEEAAVNSLRTLFGNKITDYMIVVFTGGDKLEDDDETLEDYLGRDCPEPLKEILHLCENRRVLFNNKTNNEKKKDDQVQELLTHVNLILAKNGGNPYTDELFVELKEGAIKLHDQSKEVISSDKAKQEMHIAYEEQLKRLTEMVELRLRENTSRLEKRVEEEQVARLNEQKMAQDALMKSNYIEIHQLKESLERAQKEKKSNNETHELTESLKRAQKEVKKLQKKVDELQKDPPKKGGPCAFL